MYVPANVKELRVKFGGIKSISKEVVGVIGVFNSAFVLLSMSTNVKRDQCDEP